MGIALGRCYQKEKTSSSSKRNLEKELETNRRWIEALEQQIDRKIRELSMSNADVQLELSKNKELRSKLNSFEKETEILKSMLKKSENEEERLRMELIRAYKELRCYREKLHKATDQLKSHILPGESKKVSEEQLDKSTLV
ncbi:uncharacterized protein LOC110240945 [Exaiptasia diaphana]|uniref:Uncharacterized protein n=1 Tax=Exaiptasia diaphana TaxID=2652724 RepID=A0A913XCN5_EXADI|nr:uncharacterized protein LOC110240945 [Exaiptasia diaphana]KXJ13047.1 hypothetical protein AC249_AIPGENE22848 [Exaiptasia diaphana]